MGCFPVLSGAFRSLKGARVSLGLVSGAFRLLKGARVSLGLVSGWFPVGFPKLTSARQEPSSTGELRDMKD